MDKRSSANKMSTSKQWLRGIAMTIFKA